MAQSDFLPFDANEYRAVVNPTHMIMQTWGYGRRLVLVPGELDDPKRAPIQFVQTRIARKAVKNQRRFLEMMTVEQGMRLLNLARELKDFHSAYKQLTGKTGAKAAELLMERQEKSALRRVLLHELGVPDDILTSWTVSDMRAVIKDQTLVADLDESGRPRIGQLEDQGTVFDAVKRASASPTQHTDQALFKQYAHEEVNVLPSSEARVGENGNPGDFITPEQLDDKFQLPEDVAARSTAEYDAESGGAVAGTPSTAPSEFIGMQATTEITSVDAKDLEAPLPEPVAPLATERFKTEQEEVVALRSHLDKLGVPWHPRSGAPKLRREVDDAIARSINTEAVG